MSNKPNYHIDFSSNSNFVCTYCHQQIKIGDCRYGVITESNQIPKKWKHFNCIEEDKKNQLFNDLSDQEIYSLKKFSSLTDDEKNTVVTLMDNISNRVRIPKRTKEKCRKIIDKSKQGGKRSSVTNENKKNQNRPKKPRKPKKLKATYPQKHECDVCGKCFNRYDHLNIHSRIHTGERPHKCSVCGKTFGLKGHLTTHMRIHTGYKPYQCDICGRRCNQKINLSTHMLIHTGDKPFECDKCYKCFSLKNSLKRHLKSQHNYKPEISAEVLDYISTNLSTNPNIILHESIKSEIKSEIKNRVFI